MPDGRAVMIELRMLGAPDLRRNGDEPSVSLRLQPKRLALLAYLALTTTGGYCRRDTLLALFWPERDEAHARNALSQAVHGIRRTLGREHLRSRGPDELRLLPDDLWCDASAFRFALKNDDLVEALALYRGDLLDGLHISGAPAFEHWLDAERTRFRRLAVNAAAALADREEAAGHLVGAAHRLRALLDLAPYDEVALRRLMTALDRLGDRVGALRAYETFTVRLARDLDLSPDPETRSLAARLRASGPAVSPPDAGALPSVAVLPFVNLSADPEQAYFCDGITEEVISTLAKIRGLRVAARSSVFTFRDQPSDVRTIAQRLGVQAVIEGSVRHAGDRLRITAQLISASDGYHLWSERYDRPQHDVFAIQDEIARSVAEALRVELLEGPRQEPSPSATQDMDAHALYLKGLFHRRKRTPEDLQKACAYFEQAVARDPGYARAHAALAFTYTLSGWFLYDVFAPGRAFPLAREAARRAMDLDPRLAEAHLATAYLRHAYEWDGPGAEEAFRKALALDPGNLDVIGNYSGFLVSHGRQDEAIALTERGRWMDPFWIMPRVGVGIWLVAARRFDEAIERLRQAHDMEPRLFVAPLFLGDVYRFTGRLDEARTAYTRVRDLIGDRPLILGRLGALCAAEGRPDAARDMVSRLHVLADRRHVLPSIVADIYLALEELDAALGWLERACEARDTTLTLLRSWPSYDPLRSRRRFRHLLQTVGLDERPPPPA